ncbi:MAG: serine O-acetyltransferase [Spirochaetales bacterium]|jgi:serine O-acetyltransferase|nr:serine O-acetyltransferase [Spirochaetales bacterium]
MIDILRNVTEAIFESYTKVGINHLDGGNLPSRQAILKIVNDYEWLIFPGYTDEQPVDSREARFVISETVNRLARSLTAEISKSLCYKYRDKYGASAAPFRCAPEPSRVAAGRESCSQTAPGYAGCMSEAETVTKEILVGLPALRQRIHLDVEAAYLGDPAAKSTEEVILSYPGLEALIVHRFAHELWIRGIPLLPRIMSEHIHGKTGIDIHPGANIGAGFFIDHGTGVVVGETTLIGSNVKIYQGVTLGALSVKKELSDSKRHPTIEDNVTIYAGATILGGETVIGKGSTIGGNVWLTRSVPAHSKVYNNPEEYRIEK